MQFEVVSYKHSAKFVIYFNFQPLDNDFNMTLCMRMEGYSAPSREKIKHGILISLGIPT